MIFKNSFFKKNIPLEVQNECENRLDFAKSLSSCFQFQQSLDALLPVIPILFLYRTDKNLIRLLADCYMEIGNILRDQGISSGINSSLKFHEKASQLWYKLKRYDKYAETLWYIGASYEMNNNLRTALSFYNKSLEILDSIGEFNTQKRNFQSDSYLYC